MFVKGGSLEREGEVRDEATKVSGARSHPAVKATVIWNFTPSQREPLVNFKQRNDISDILF